mmetsp:Transcript_46789/g.50454  ORF Transcript_46789/g.50454 Transcript_46789/m.50454 type:complete len:162 (-) Transcript_46789:18-503(-)
MYSIIIYDVPNIISNPSYTRRLISSTTTTIRSSTVLLVVVVVQVDAILLRCYHHCTTTTPRVVLALHLRPPDYRCSFDMLPTMHPIGPILYLLSSPSVQPLLSFVLRSTYYLILIPLRCSSSRRRHRCSCFYPSTNTVPVIVVDGVVVVLCSPLFSNRLTL